MSVFTHLRADWSAWAPDAELDAVIVTSTALRGLTTAQRSARDHSLLQRATADGGIHLVEAQTRNAPHRRFRSWRIAIEGGRSPSSATGAVRCFSLEKRSPRSGPFGVTQVV